MKVLLALTAAVVLGIIVLNFGSPEMVRYARAIEPIGTLWVNAIRMTVIPLVVASLIAAFAGAPDARTVGRVGGLSVSVFLIMLAATAVITVLATPPLLARVNVVGWTGLSTLEKAVGLGAASTTAVPKFSQWLVELIPTNPIKAATDGAMLPLIVFCMAMGAATTRIVPASREALVGFFTSIADAMLRVMQWILALAPIGVFALALPLTTRVGIGVAGAAIIYMGLVCLLCLAVGLLLYPTAVFFGRVSLLKFARALAPAQAVAITSRSSLAALPALIAGAERDLGLEPALARFYLPLATSMFRVGAVIAQVSGVLFIARLYQIPITGMALWSVALASLLTSFSVPGVAGGSIIVMVPVMMAAKVPVEGIGLLLAIDTIPDMFRTTLNVTGHMTGATIVARHAGPVASRVGTVSSAA